MKRALFVLALLGCALLPMPASAAELNLHNGAIEFYNHSPFTVRVTIVHDLGARIQSGVLVPSHTWMAFNTCCYAAGSVYAIYAAVDGSSSFPRPLEGHVRPMLCNKNGIPFGYAKAHLVIYRDDHGVYQWYLNQLGGVQCP